MVYKNTVYQHPVDDLSYHMKKGKLRQDTLDYKDVIDYYRSMYVPENMVISIVSNIPFSTILREISRLPITKLQKRCLIHQKRQLQLQLPMYSVLPNQRDIQFSFFNKKGVENTLVTMGFRVCGSNTPDQYLLVFLKTILVSYMYSRFFKLLREETGLVYSVGIDTNFYDTIGDFTLSTQTDNHRLIQVGNSSKKHATNSYKLIPVLVSALNELVEKGVTAEEVSVAKGYLKGKYTLKTENINNNCYYNGYTMLVLNKTVEEIVPLQKIYETHFHSITRKQVNDCIRRYFKRELLTVTLLSSDLPDKGSIIKEFDTLFSMK
jgi:predicted Zn-dependent peptidase